MSGDILHEMDFCAERGQQFSVLGNWIGVTGQGCYRTAF
jgi:hypothetical protein